MPAVPPGNLHYETIAAAVPRGELTVFYGAGINIPQHPMPRTFVAETSDFCPTGTELALHIARKCNHPDLEFLAELKEKEEEACKGCNFNQAANAALARLAAPALSRVAQYAQTMRGTTGYSLKQDLHRMFGRAFPTTEMHDLLAELPGRSEINRLPTFITTNYDTVLERALAKRGEPFDVLFYRAPGPGIPVWLYHWENAHLYYVPGAQDPPEGYDRMVTDVAGYQGLPLGDGKRKQTGDGAGARTLIVKIHGTVAPDGAVRSSFVISDNDYVTFLRQVSVENPLPNLLVDRLKNSHFLFLGYGLADWNILALCQQLWKKRTLEDWESWAIQFRPAEYDVARWAAESANASSAVSVYDMDISAYARELRHRLP